MAVAIIALLVSILAPSLVPAKEAAANAVCKTKIRCLQIGNDMYQQASAGWYAPGAANMGYSANRDKSTMNLQRWFGRRSSKTQPFSDENGALSDYLSGRAVRQCPGFREYLTGFEAGCGGYGYNDNYVGMYVVPGGSGGLYKPGNVIHDFTGNRADAFARPPATVAFTDTAYVDGGYKEYSFCESPRMSTYDWPLRPTIHFRHRGWTNVTWLDSHVTEETMTFSNEGGSTRPDAGRPIDFGVGWFGPQTNELFDCE